MMLLQPNKTRQVTSTPKCFTTGVDMSSGSDCPLAQPTATIQNSCPTMLISPGELSEIPQMEAVGEWSMQNSPLSCLIFQQFESKKQSDCNWPYRFQSSKQPKVHSDFPLRRVSGQRIEWRKITIEGSWAASECVLNMGYTPNDCNLGIAKVSNKNRA